MYDAIVVGARCAGSPTAMLLARQGFKVLLVDRATFPSDTISTHIMWPHGAEILARWGLLASLAATGAPPICRHMTFDVGAFALRGAIPDANDGRGGFCPRRTVLDTLLLHAAADAGVDVRAGFIVDELLVAGDSVVGIRGHGKDTRRVEERGRIVIGGSAYDFNTNSFRAFQADFTPTTAGSAGVSFTLVPSVYNIFVNAVAVDPSSQSVYFTGFQRPAADASLVVVKLTTTTVSSYLHNPNLVANGLDDGRAILVRNFNEVYVAGVVETPGVEVSPSPLSSPHAEAISAKPRNGARIAPHFLLLMNSPPVVGVDGLYSRRSINSDRCLRWPTGWRRARSPR